MAQSGQVYSFGELGSELESQAGGKGATLARLYRAGYPVPDGFVVLPSAFAGDDLAPEAWASICEALERLRGDDPGAPLAVRSSALAEDSARASFAGQFETVLDVRTGEDLRAAILDVHRSRRSRRVRAYSRAQGIEAPHVMAVIVQRMVPAELSGVLFTADPVSGSRDRMTGSLVHGTGDRLVSGETSGEAFRLNRPRGPYLGPDDLAPHAKRLRELADRLERELGQPQDIEWAVADGKLVLLQSRPITTLAPYDPATGTWNHSRTGDFLWSNVNFGEAVSAVMTPLTWTVIDRVLSEWRFLPGHPTAGNIGGRPYLNLSVFASVFRALGKSTRQLLDTLEPTVYTPLPKGMEIPLIELSKWSAVRNFPRWTRIELRQRRGARALAGYVSSNPAWCAAARASIRAAETGDELLSLWRREIQPHLTHGAWVVLGSAAEFAHYAAPLRRELNELVGPQDADALLHGSGDEDEELPANLGPLVSIAEIARGEMGREEYLARYGHRGPHEFELSIARPSEDPEWLDRQVERYRSSPPKVRGLLEKRQARSLAAWRSLGERTPKRIGSIRRRVARARALSSRREAARSEYVRDRWVVRELALRAGEWTGLADGIFFLTLDELLDALSGDRSAFGTIPARREAHARYGSLPPYPPVIRGRFDPVRWAADPGRRSDYFDAHWTAGSEPTASDPARTVRGAAGSAGSVEGLVRCLLSPREAARLQEGEILVTTQTDIEWTPLFPLAAAVVTDVGAAFSHAAIVARELGIPAVVGCGDATMRLHTGDRVLVDGGRGEVRLLS